MSVEHGHESGEKIEFPRSNEAHERQLSQERESRDQEKPIKPEKARLEVEKALEKAETKKHPSQSESHKNAPQRHVISDRQKKMAYRQTMHTIQKEMSPVSRSFSKFIHNPVVETTSEVAGKTIARPSSILYGSLCAFILLMALYLLAKHNGFRLSGFEFMGLFAVGWAAGLLIEFLQHMITGKR